MDHLQFLQFFQTFVRMPFSFFAVFLNMYEWLPSSENQFKITGLKKIEMAKILNTEWKIK